MENIFSRSLAESKQKKKVKLNFEEENQNEEYELIKGSTSEFTEILVNEKKAQ